MKYGTIAILAACSLAVLTMSCLSPRAQEIVKASAPLVINLAQIGELSGHLPPGTSVVVKDGAAVVTSDGTTEQKLMTLKELGLAKAVKDGKLKEGDALMVDQAGTSLVQLVEILRTTSQKPPAEGTLTPASTAEGPQNPFLPAPPKE